MMNRQQFFSIVIILSLSCTSLGVLIGYLTFHNKTSTTANGPWQEPPEDWHEIGVPMKDDFQQTVSFGDFTGNGTLEMIGSYSHGVAGIFRHYQNEQGDWGVETLHPRFDFSGNQSYTWPVKGIVNEDIDGDGLQEIVTMADIINYPPNHAYSSRPFPGVIYIDPNAGPLWEPKPLFYGAWAENLTGGIMIIPSFVPRSFSGSLKDGYHILVTCNRFNDNKYFGHVFLLEQPEEGFYPFDYRFVTKTIIGAEPHNQEPFYLKRFWLYDNLSDSYRELYWDPAEMNLSDRLQARATVTNLYDDSPGLDLMMWGTFRDEHNAILASKIVFYRRVAADVNHTYAFQEEQSWWMGGVELFPANRGNFDGNATNGAEAIVFGLANTVAVEGIGLNGFLYFVKEGASWTIRTIDFNFDWTYPYIWVYSSPQPWDYNKDGFDDIAIYAMRTRQGANTWGDIVIFQNLGDDFGIIPLSHSRFNISTIRPIVLWGNDSFNWDVDTFDLDNDGEKELIVSLGRREPYSEGTAGFFKVFYYKREQTSPILRLSVNKNRNDMSILITKQLLKEEFRKKFMTREFS
ncbi:MAG: hypothetical protein DRP02_08455 [Candidatus Gerdarchaeota archaeon]|nr:MAG: hypothetical protein DRP02_08455 [Candidatus Gerdarchaeota archaeon]